MQMPKNEIYEMLMGLTKVEIDFYRRILGCDVRSNLKKSDMAMGVALYIEHDSEQWLRRFPTWELDLLTDLLKQTPGQWSEPKYQPLPSILEALHLVYVDVTEDNQVRYMLSEVMHDSIQKGLSKAVAYTEMRKFRIFEEYMFGALNLFGLVPLTFMYSMFSRISSTFGKDKDDEIEWTINSCKFVLDSIFLKFYHMKVGDTAYFFHPAIQQEYSLYKAMVQKNIEEYKKFSDTEIYEAGRTYPYISTCQGKPFCQALIKELKKLKFEGEDLNIVYRELYTSAQEMPNELMGMISAMANDRLTSMAQLQGLVSAVMEFSNNIPRWELKGYSSHEVFEKYEKPKLKPLPSQPFNPMNFAPKNIGRNDPCPCGSGKKYKNCHGKMS